LAHSINKLPPSAPVDIKSPPPTPADIILSLLQRGPDGLYTNVFEVATSVTVLKLAYEIIKSKPGNMVRGTTGETLDEISVEWFEKTSDKLRREFYKLKPGPASRAYISPKQMENFALTKCRDFFTSRQDHSTSPKYGT